MQDILKKIFSTLLIIILILMLFGAILSTLNSLGIGIGSWFRVETVETVPLQNGLKGMSNGGLTPDEIEKFKNDDDLPYSDDVFREYVVKETDKYVVFVRQVEDKSNQIIYPNISFVKTSKGLIWDGAWGVTAQLHTNWFTGAYDWDNISFNLNLDFGSYQKTEYNTFVKLFSLIDMELGGSVETAVTFSDFNENFCTDFYAMNVIALLFHGNLADEKAMLYNLTHEHLTNHLLIKYFENLTDNDLNNVEMIMGNGTGNDGDIETLSLMNSWATYLWQQVKTDDKSDNSKIVDISNYFVKLIPEDEQINYPIPTEKQSEYDGLEYYPIFDCKIFADATYTYESVNINRNIERIEDNVKNENVAPLPPAQTVEYARINVKLNNVENSDLTMFDITEHPVLIQFTNANPDFNKLTNFKTKNNFLDGISIAVPLGQIYYNISSNELVFDSYNGLISINKMHSDLKFDFTYEYNFVDTFISIDPITSIPAGTINLADNPVRIVLTGQNNEGVYEFVFDNNSKLTTKLNQLIKKGTYTYSIISNQLVFNPLSGSITVTTTDRDFIFNYNLGSELSDLNFSVNVKSGNFWTYPGSAFVATFDEETAQLLSEKFTGDPYRWDPNGICNISIKIFDTDQTILAQRNEMYHGSGNWFESVKTTFLASNFDNDTEYFVKITFTRNETGAFYVTDLISFYIFFGTDYKFEITAEEN